MPNQGCRDVSRARRRGVAFALAAAWLPLAASADPPEPPSAAPSADEPRGEVTLAQARAAALLRSPELAAFSGELRAREARALQAGAFPNPELLVEVENVAGSGDFSGADLAETSFWLGQPLELGGKRAKRRRIAEREASLADWDYQRARADVLAEVSGTFAELWVAQEQLALALERSRWSERSLALLPSQPTSPAGALERAHAEVAQVERAIESERAAAAVATARLRLAALWGGREARFERAQGELFELAPPPELPELLARLDEAPELARWQDEIGRHQAVVALADSGRIPDVTAAAGVRRFEESDDAAFLFGLALPFPLFDRKQGERAAARSELSRARHEREGARLRAETELRVQLSELRESHAEVQALRERALPRLGETLRQLRDGHERGRAGAAERIEVELALLALRERELAALLRYHVASAEIERLTAAQPRSERLRR